MTQQFHSWVHLKEIKCSVVHARPVATPWIKAHQAPLSMEFSRQEYCIYLYLTENWAQIKEMTRSPKVQTHLTNTKDHTLLRMILSHHFQIQNRLWKADHWKWKCSRKH